MLETFLGNFAIHALPPAETLVACAAAALIASMILSSAFSPFMVIINEFVALQTKRTFYARAARQTAQSALCTGTVAALVGAGFMAWFAMNEPALLAPPYVAPLTLTAGSIITALALLAVYTLQRPGKPSAGKGRIIIGLASAAWSAFALFCCTGIVRRLLHTPPEFEITLPTAIQLQLFFEIPFDSFFWFLLLESIPLGFALGGAFTCVWLLLVREKQDYGRDYYNFALPYCARWAFGFTLLAVLAGAFVFFESRKLMLPELSHDPSLLLDILSAAFPLLACLLWIFIMRSPRPMRHKVSAVLALLFLLTGFAGQMLMLNKVIPSP